MKSLCSITTCDMESHHFSTLCYKSNFRNRRRSMKREEKGVSLSCFQHLEIQKIQKSRRGDNKCTSILLKHKICQQTNTTFKGPLSLWLVPFWENSLQPQLLKFLYSSKFSPWRLYPSNSYTNTVTNAVVLSFEGENVKVLQ